MEAFGLLFLFDDTPFEDVIQLCRIFLSRSKDSEQDTVARHVGCTENDRDQRYMRRNR